MKCKYCENDSTQSAFFSTLYRDIAVCMPCHRKREEALEERVRSMEKPTTDLTMCEVSGCDHYARKDRTFHVRSNKFSITPEGERGERDVRKVYACSHKHAMRLLQNYVCSDYELVYREKAWRSY